MTGQEKDHYLETGKRQVMASAGDAASVAGKPQWASSTQTKAVTSLRLTRLLSECG